MGNLALAVKSGIKDFFKRQADHTTFVKATKKGLHNYSRWSYDELCLLTVLAGVHKHSFGIPGSIVDAVRQGRWRYHDLKDIEARAEEIFAETDLSTEGKKLIVKMMKQGKEVNAQQFSRHDAAILDDILNEVNISRGECVFF